MSKRPAFTLPPWTVTKTPAGKSKIVDAQGFSIANMTAGAYSQQEHDARLIAAAPDMYANLVDAAHALRAVHVNILADDIDNLLSKARGES